MELYFFPTLHSDNPVRYGRNTDALVKQHYSKLIFSRYEMVEDSSVKK